VVKLAQATSQPVPTRKQHDFFTLIEIPNQQSSCSHLCNSFCNTPIDGAMKKKKIYLPKRLIARKGFSPSTLATIHTQKKQKYTKYTQTLRAETTKSKSSI